VHLVDFPATDLLNKTARDQWTANVVADCAQAFCDGLNLDFESPITAHSAASRALTQLTYDTCAALHQSNKFASCSFDVAWASNDIDGRAFDYAGLAAASDFLFIMDYDTRSQLTLAKCFAGPNSPTSTMVGGFKSYLSLGIHPKKLIIGGPWYGYNYPCLPGHAPTDPSPCAIQPIPFRGAPCSDAAGSEEPFAFIHGMLLARQNTTDVQFDKTTQTVWFNFVNNGTVHQMWFDNARTLRFKWLLAKNLGAQGVGVWTVDMLPYGTNPLEATEMWRAFLEYFD